MDAVLHPVMDWGFLANKSAFRPLRALCAALALALALLVPTTLRAQTAVAPAQAQAVVVGPLSLVANQELNFGRIAPGAAAGTVVLNSDTLVCTTTGPIARVGTCQPAEFTGMGVRRMTVRIAVPTTITLNRVGGGATMTVSNLTVDTTPDLQLRGGSGNGLGAGNRRYEIIPLSGIFNFRVGGTLNVGANQLGGVYNGTFAVTVQYQ